MGGLEVENRVKVQGPPLGQGQLDNARELRQEQNSSCRSSDPVNATPNRETLTRRSSRRHSGLGPRGPGPWFGE